MRFLAYLLRPVFYIFLLFAVVYLVLSVVFGAFPITAFSESVGRPLGAWPWLFEVGLWMLVAWVVLTIAVKLVLPYAETKIYRSIKAVFVIVPWFIISWFLALLIVAFISNETLNWSDWCCSEPITLGPWSVVWEDIVGPFFWLLLLIVLFFIFAIPAIYPEIFARLVRFFDSGRLGRGGAGRFAGMTEELEERYRCFSNGTLLSAIEDRGVWAVIDALRSRPIAPVFYGFSLFYFGDTRMGIGGDHAGHMLTFAGTRSGKGASAIIPNLLLWRHSALVIDPKGTAAHVTARWRQEQGQRVYFIDPYGTMKVKGRDSDCFNPLEHLNPDSETIVEDIGQITEALIVPSEKDKKDAHFDESARSLLGGYIAHVITSPDFEYPALATVRDLLTLPPDEQDALHGAMLMNEAAGGIAKATAVRVAEGEGKNEYQSVRATIFEQTKWLTYLPMRRVLSKSSFRFEELKQRPTTIYVIIPPERLDTSRQFLRLFLNLGLTRFFVGGKAPLPTLFIIDEAHSLGNMREIPRAYGIGAGYNMILWSFFQDKGQLDTLYGAEAGTFVQNSRAVQVFAVSDETTAKFTSEMLGKRGLRGPALRAGDAVDLRSPGDVRLEVGSETGRQYILRAGKTPMILERARYWKQEPFKSRADQDPDY